MKRVLSLGDITNVTADDNTLDDDNGVFTQVRGRRKKSKKTGIQHWFKVTATF